MSAVDVGKGGRYRVVERLAEGGMAVVDLVVVLGPDGFERQLVLKRIRPRLSRDPRFARMFVDEARIASQLNHPNIVHISELGKIDGDYFLAMEYVPGVDLERLRRTYAERGERIPVALAVFITVEVCRALDYAHRKRGPDGAPLGIVHRDVSPQNVLLSREGAVKLADFGIARATERQEQTLDDVIKGKVAYMSPEQLLGELLDGRSDIYAVGVILHTLLAGEHPYAAADDGRTIERALAHDWPPPSATAPDVPSTLDAIVSKASAKAREGRHETAGQLAEELEQFIFEARLRATAGELASEMKRLLGEERADRQTPRVSLDDALGSELRRLVGDDDGLPSYTAELQPATARPMAASAGGRTQLLFGLSARADPAVRGAHAGTTPELPRDLARPAGDGEPSSLDRGTEQLDAVRWERPANAREPAPGRAPDRSAAATGAGRRLAPWLWLAIPLAILIGAVAAWALAAGVTPVRPDAATSRPDAGAAVASPPPRAPDGAPTRALTLDAGASNDGDAATDADGVTAAGASSDGGGDDVTASGAPTRPRRPPRRPSAPRTGPGEEGWLRIVTRPHYAEVYVDGRRRGTTPALIRVPAGRRRVHLVNPQLGHSESRTVTVTTDHSRAAPAAVVVDGF